MQRGVGLIPDDRFREGLIPEFSVQENMILGWQRDDAYTSGPLLSAAKIKENGEAMIDAFQIKVPSGATPVNHLSGGNAQKVILAREFSQSSTLLLANQPTRGLDLGVIEYVYSQIIAKRDQGYAVLLASEELEDLLNISDRIAVMSDGKIVGIVNAQDSSVPEIGQLMTGAQAA
jgi:simple sugar transport system ATP-binding protein